MALSISQRYFRLNTTKEAVFSFKADGVTTKLAGSPRGSNKREAVLALARNQETVTIKDSAEIEDGNGKGSVAETYTPSKAVPILAFAMMTSEEKVDFVGKQIADTKERVKSADSTLATATEAEKNARETHATAVAQNSANQADAKAAHNTALNNLKDASEELANANAILAGLKELLS